MPFDNKAIKRQIQEINSKHCLPILSAIDNDNGISQGELAPQVNLLPSGLSAVIKKMTNCDIPLVIVTQTGKYRRYSLPEYVERYLADQKKENNDTQAQQVQEDRLFLLLQRFVEEAGKNWKETMNSLLLDEEIDYSSNIGKTFSAFINQMKTKTLTHDEDIDEIRAFINNEVLLYLIDKYSEADL